MNESIAKPFEEPSYTTGSGEASRREPSSSGQSLSREELRIQPTAKDVYAALWANDQLRNLEYGYATAEIDGGTVVLKGHVTAARTRQLAEQIARQVPGVMAVENRLVDDDALVNEVCRALVADPCTVHETVLVAARHGVIVLSGDVSSAAARHAAEQCVASVPQVRAVSNFIKAPGVVVHAEDERIVQPSIGEEVIATDAPLGRVAAVIINPRHRRVAAVVTRGAFPDLRSPGHRCAWDPYEGPVCERTVVVPVMAIDQVTASAVWLRISAIEAAQFADFDPAIFRRAGAGWQPPYPYQTEDVWLCPSYWAPERDGLWQRP